MATDEKKRQRTEVGYRGNRAADLGQYVRESTLAPNVDMFRNYFANQANQQIGDYTKTMDQYQDFARTGGFTPMDLANFRARAVSPVRAAYSNAQRNVNRQRSLQGGYSPGFNVMQGRLAREGSQAVSDAATNAEADIASLVQRGKLAGLGGAASLYGTTPGQAATFGNQLLGASGQLLGGVENEMQTQMGLINAMQNAAQLPGKWEGTFGRLRDIGDFATGVIYPWTIPTQNRF